jgi:hypothetical protein
MDTLPKFDLNTTNPYGADDQTRTGDLLITSELLYLLSYVGGDRTMEYFS